MTSPSRKIRLVFTSPKSTPAVAVSSLLNISTLTCPCEPPTRASVTVMLVKLSRMLYEAWVNLMVPGPMSSPPTSLAT